ncbi:MAG TPA: hypothetical protein VIV11_35120 [Kofleriaceae bacterium]
MRLMMILTVLLGFAACSSPTVNNTINNGSAAMKEKDTASGVKNYAKSTPPSGATSMGMMSSPKAGNQTIPITNVEVYVFTADIDDDAAGETLYWAYDGEEIYVWGTIDIVCIDDDGFDTGETGEAYFIYEADEYGYGWMVATDSCGYSTLYGCSDDGSGETCGGCDWDDSYIVCAAE